MATINTSLIASSGGDYATVALWESDTDNDLVTADVVEVGELASETFAQQGTTLSGATTDATRYRVLTYAESAYDVATLSGPTLTFSGLANGVSILVLSESHSRVIGIGLRYDSAGHDDVRGVTLSGSSTVADGCTAVLTNTVASGWTFGFLVSGANSVARNSVAILDPDETSSNTGEVGFESRTNAMRQVVRRKLLDAIRDRTDISLTAAQEGWILDYLEARV